MNSQNDSRNAVAKAISATLGALAVVVLSILLTTPALAVDPCCEIAALNPLTGVVTAKVTSSGQIFQFTVANKAQLRALRVGSAVYANFGTHQVSFDGRTIAGNIVSATPTPIAPAVNPRPSVNSIPPLAGATPNPSGPIDGAKLGTNPAAPLDGTRVNAAAPLDGARVNAAAPLDGAKVNAAAPLDGARVNAAAPLDGARVNAAGASTVPMSGTNLTPASPLDGARSATSAAVPQNQVQAAQNPAACCEITGINSSSGLVTARVTATGQMFQFSINGATVHQLHVGQGVFANFKANRISLDGQHVQGTIIAKGAGPVRLPTNAQNPGNTPPSGTVTPPNTKGDPVRPENSVLTGNPNNDGSQSNNSTSGGWDVHNNASAATSSDAAGPSTISPERNRNNDDNSKNPTRPNGPLGPNVGAQQFNLPKLTAGAMQFVQDAKSPSSIAIRQRRLPNSNLVQLRGIDEIDKSPVSQAVKDFVLLHARTLPSGEVDHYAVNTQLAEQWFATHPEPEAVKQAAAKARSTTHAGCHAFSTHCASEAAKHGEGEAKRQEEKLLHEAQNEWKHLTHEATNDWHQIEGCFVDHTLSLPNVPVSFTTTPGFPLSMKKSGSTKNDYGSASGSVSGTATFGVPITPDFNVDLEVFYVPCLPFMIRPKSIETNGTLEVGGVFQANLNATGQFDQQFTIPPGGGPHFPIAVLPLALGPVPIAELDLSVYVDGTLAVDGSGTLNGSVQMQASHKTAFDVICNGHGCDLKSHNIPVPDSVAESVKMQGVIHVRPAVYAALQLDFDIDLLTMRAGPEPYLLGEIYGCSPTTARQNTATGNSTQELYALTADLDWGIDLRAEALVGTDKVGEHKWDLTKGHILFKDLVNSNALIPSLAGPAQGSLNQPALFNVKMPACYPYHDEIEYRAQWTGGATASTTAPNSGTMTATVKPTGLPLGPTQRPEVISGTAEACTLQTGEADCWNNPSAATALDLTWPSAGAYGVTVVPVRDKHGRVFTSQPAQGNITIQ
jgi:hypothetical protein